MKDYRKQLQDNIKGKKCPTCGCSKIGIDNWEMFEGERDWFYYCKECDDTFK